MRQTFIQYPALELFCFTFLKRLKGIFVIEYIMTIIYDNNGVITLLLHCLLDLDYERKSHERFVNLTGMYK